MATTQVEWDNEFNKVDGQRQRRAHRISTPLLMGIEAHAIALPILQTEADASSWIKRVQESELNCFVWFVGDVAEMDG